jgi:phosphodiesterase/alkaline phosphatase D-like protein
MPRRSLVPLVVLLALLALPGSASAASFTYGVAAGEVTSGSARVWARAPQPGLVTVEVSRSSRFGAGTKRVVVRALRSADRTVQVTVRGLRANTRYFYRWRTGIVGRPAARRSPAFTGRASASRVSFSRVGRLQTAPLPTEDKTIRFAWSGDADAQAAPGSSTPFYNSLGDQSFAVYRAMQRERNDFNINMGDTIYSDSEVPGKNALAATRAQKDAKYKQNLALRNLTNLRNSGNFYSHPDDHEFVNDFALNERLEATKPNGQKTLIPGRTLYGPGVRAFRDYAPVNYTRDRGFYRVFHWGKNLDVFFLDERSFRSVKAGSPSVHVCDNPQSHQPDLAPTARADKRTLFSALVPSLGQPVSPACLARLRDPKRSMLGQRQEAEFFRAISHSKATFKVVMNEVNIQQFFALPYDRWEGYEADRQRVLHFMKDHVKNAIFLTTDVHANLANDARFDTFPQDNSAAKSSGILDVATGPVATMSYKREINGSTGQDPGSGSSAGAIDSVFFTPPPPAGVGMTCSALNVFSYGQVTVSRDKLVVQAKDQNGQPVREEEGSQAPCPTITLNRK